MWKTIIQLCFVFCFFLIPTPRFLIAQIKIMPLGDSISKGVSGPSTDDAGYRDDLAEFLTSEGIDFDFVGSLAHGAGFDSEHEGHDGFRADQILDNIASYLSANPPDMILLHLGTNDISSDQTPESTRDEIGALVDEIHAFNPDIKIVLSSLIPRIDERDETTTALNQLLFTLTASKREAGVQIFYAGMNEIFKCNSNWDADYFTPTDIVHPNDAGFHLMAQVWFYAVTTAMNVGADLSVTDNFERSSLGAPWDTDPEFEIRSGNLVNTAKDGTKRWQYMAAFKGVMNPTHVAIRWSAKANKRGIRRGGLALLLDSASQDASGFLAYITTEDNMLRLWTIENGVAGEDLNLDVKSQTGPPAAGDKFGVTIAGDTDSLRFDYFVNDVFAGRITTGNSGLGGNFYAGVIVRHNRRNDIAEFFAEGSGDFEPPAQIEDLNPIEVSATSVVLTWTAPGDDGHNGRAFQYDVRYSLSPIDTENDFKSAIQVNEAPAPTAAGTPQSFVDLNLEPETTYYFALQVFDEAGNPSPVSNVASFTTADGELLTDDFNRSGLGPDWSHAPTLEISNDEMVNSSIEPANWDLAVFHGKSNPATVSFKWSATADTTGIDQGGIAVMLDSPEIAANGYLITRRTLKNEIRLWRIVNGQNPSEPIITAPLLARPNPGEEFRIAISSDQNGNHFTVFINGRQDATISDSSFFIDPANIVEWYTGVMLAGGRNNNIDDFKILTTGFPVSVEDNETSPPGDFVLSQNYPNPFNPETTIRFQLPKTGLAALKVYDILGREIRVLVNRDLTAGSHSVLWDGRDRSGSPVASGVYFYEMRAGDFREAKRMSLIR